MPATVAETYGELFHYTGVAGLEGIVKSQTLWATHAAFMSDGAEIKAFQVRLPAILRPGVASGLDDLILRVPGNQRLVDEHGGIDTVVEQWATEIANSMYRVLLGTGATKPIAEPYITSFCTAENEQIAQHGLLSQWRGYGQEGGYAIVLDTEKLEDLLREEHEKWHYKLLFADAVYSSDRDSKIREELGHEMDEMAEAIAEWLRADGAPAALEKTYHALTGCACRYKHWGFHEEKEVRIIAMPLSTNVLTEQEFRELTEKEKPRRTFVRGGTTVPCIHLFEGITQLPEKPLPITRIIVGPHRDKEKRQRAVEILLRQLRLDVPVTISDIPYIGH